MSGGDIAYTQRAALAAILCSMIITFVYRSVIEYTSQTTEMNFKLWDVKTCTPSDYTIELNITQSMYDTFNSNNNGSHIKEYIKQAIE